MLLSHKMVYIVLIVVVVIALLLTVVSGTLIYNFSINKKSPIHMSRLFHFTDDDKIRNSGASGTQEEQEWFRTGEHTSVNSVDGFELHARYFPNEDAGHCYVITCHGTACRGEHMASYAKNFYDMGFHVLVPDARAHGESGGDLLGLGWMDRLDVLSWAQVLIAQDPDAEIVLHGASLGAATVLMTAGESMPSNIKAGISDSGYTTAYDQFLSQAEGVVRWLMIPGVRTASLISKRKSGCSFHEASAVEQISHSQIPLLFIQGDKDSIVPIAMLDELYHAANCEKEKLVVSGADHTLSYVTAPDLYWDTVKNFVKKYL